MTISTSGATVHSLKDTLLQVDSAHGGKQRSSSLESGHETSFGDSTKKKHKRRKSVDLSHSPSISMLTDAAGDAAPDQSNPRVIIVDEMLEGDEISHHDRMLGNPFTSPGNMVAGLNGHGGALPLDHSHGSGDGGTQKEEFCTMVQTLEGILPLSTVTADNNPHSGGNFDIPKGG